MTPLQSDKVVSALSAAGYTCTKNSRYQSCANGKLTVWVLTGTKHVLPLLTMTVQGSRHESFSYLGDQIDSVLRIAHVNEVQLIKAWYAKQEYKLSNTTIGKWQLALSREAGGQPGTVLTLTDRTCSTDCQVE